MAVIPVDAEHGSDSESSASDCSLSDAEEEMNASYLPLKVRHQQKKTVLIEEVT